MNKFQFLAKLKSIEALKFGNFTLASGAESEFYLDLRYLPTNYELFNDIIRQLQLEVTSNLEYDVIIGIPLAGIPFATALAILEEKNLHLLRKNPKPHGLGKLIEGPSIKGKKILLVDDLISNGFSKEFAIQAIRNEGGTVSDLIVLVDRRESDQKEWEEKYRVNVHCLFSVSKKEILFEKS